MECPRIVYTDLNGLMCKMWGPSPPGDGRAVRVTFEREGCLDTTARQGPCGSYQSAEWGTSRAAVTRGDCHHSADKVPTLWDCPNEEITGFDPRHEAL